jgi:hypothetical protein
MARFRMAQRLTVFSRLPASNPASIWIAYVKKLVADPKM